MRKHALLLSLALLFPGAAFSATSVCYWTVTLEARSSNNEPKTDGVVLSDTFHDFELTTGLPETPKEEIVSVSW